MHNLNEYLCKCRSWDGAVCIVTELQAEQPRIHHFDSREGQTNFLLNVQGPPSLQLSKLQGYSPGDKVTKDVKPTTHLHVMPRLHVSDVVPLLIPTPSWTV